RGGPRGSQRDRPGGQERHGRDPEIPRLEAGREGAAARTSVGDRHPRAPATEGGGSEGDPVPRAGSEGTPRLKSRSSLGILFLVVFTDLLGFGIVIPLLPRYGETYASSVESLRLSLASYPFLGHVTSSPAVFLSLCLGILLSSYSLFQFVFSPIWGRLSDRFGR